MAGNQSYLELHKGLRVILLLACFVFASVALFMGAAYNFVVPGGRPYDISDFMMPFSAVLASFLLSLGMAKMVHQPARRGLWPTVVVIFGAVMLGAVVASIAVWRQHWFELVKEIFGFG